jgi:hypothetical protein
MGKPASERCFIEELFAAPFIEHGIGENRLIDQLYSHFLTGESVQGVIDLPGCPLSDLLGQLVLT